MVEWTPESLVPIRLGKFMSAAVDDLGGCGMLNAVPIGSIADDGTWGWGEDGLGWLHKIDALELIGAPYFLWSATSSCSNWPRQTRQRCHRSVYLARKGPGTFLRGEKKVA